MQNLTYVLYLSTLLKIKCHINTFLSWLRLCQCIFRFFLSCCSKNGFHSIAKIRKEIQSKNENCWNKIFCLNIFEQLISNSFQMLWFYIFKLLTYFAISDTHFCACDLVRYIFFYKTRVCLYAGLSVCFFFFVSSIVQKLSSFDFDTKTKIVHTFFKLFDHNFWAG